jgi:aryl-alcohol dehydrogenase-like predicted oxidoreductase
VERRELGRSGIEVPAVGLGTWQVLDVRGREEQSRREVVKAALEVDANLFDSSPMYGEAERVLGDALKKHGRGRAIVATKVWTSNDKEAERQIGRALNIFRRPHRALPGPQPRRRRKMLGYTPSFERRGEGERRRCDALLPLGVRGPHERHA